MGTKVWSVVGFGGSVEWFDCTKDCVGIGWWVGTEVLLVGR